MVNPTCLFVINGLGMGNSTRCHAVIEHLVKLGFRVHVLTSGNGVAYFKNVECVDSVTPMECLFYSGKNGGISGWDTVKKLGTLIPLAWKKKRQLEALLDRISPDVAVVDSEYAIMPLRSRGIPIIGLNTSEMIVTEYLKRWRQARSTHSHFWFVEFLDYLFHRHYCDLVLSPFPVRSEARHRKFRRIGLITRNAVMEHAAPADRWNFPSPRQLREVVFMLSGSVHASTVDFSAREFPFKVHVVGRDGESRGNVVYHGRKMNNIDLLVRADLLVINGGYSAVSEAFVLGKPVFVIPVHGHAEQFVNAHLVSEFGLGIPATETTVVDQLLQAYESNTWTGLKPRRAQYEIHGAREAAEAILAHVTARASNQVPVAAAQSTRA